jgi:hypothetical protein
MMMKEQKNQNEGYIFFGSYSRENKISRGCRTLTPHPDGVKNVPQIHPLPRRGADHRLI